MLPGPTRNMLMMAQIPHARAMNLVSITSAIGAHGATNDSALSCHNGLRLTLAKATERATATIAVAKKVQRSVVPLPYTKLPDMADCTKGGF